MYLLNPGTFQIRVNYGNRPVAASAPLSEHEKQDRALAIARLLEPKKVVGFDKIRVGRANDGGYVHVDDFAGVGKALSFGISDDASWDLDIAKRDIPVHQFDHTIEKGPIGHPLLNFYKQRVAAVDGPAAVSLDTVAGRLLSDCERAILKVDIEGDEWSVFFTASLETLGKFSQIACEFHGFDQAGDPNWSDRSIAALRKLRAVFEVVHVHGNNAWPFFNIGNVVLPSLIEITFANRNYYEFAESNEVFPTALDQPNLPDRPDMRLGCFKF